MMRGRTRKAAFSLVIVAALSGIAYSVASAGGTGGTDARLRTYFSVLAQPQGSDDAVPSHAVDSGDSVGSNADQSGARLAARTSSGAQVFAVPSSNGICLSVVDAGAVGSTCAPTDSAISQGVVLLSACTPGLVGADGSAKIRVTALVPDGVNAVTLALPDGDRSEPVSGNVVSWESDQVPSQLSWAANGDAVSVAVPGADGAAGLTCAPTPDQTAPDSNAPSGP
jgi:hypothetical protein